MCQSTQKWSVNSGWLATSVRYSKTSSRGRPIVTETVNGSTRRQSMDRRGRRPRRRSRSGGGPEADGLAEGARAHEGGLRRGFAPAVAAQRAERAPVVVDRDALADQRGAPAGRATAVGLRERADAAAEQRCLELGPRAEVGHMRGFCGPARDPASLVRIG